MESMTRGTLKPEQFKLDTEANPGRAAFEEYMTNVSAAVSTCPGGEALELFIDSKTGRKRMNLGAVPADMRDDPDYSYDASRMEATLGEDRVARRESTSNPNLAPIRQSRACQPAMSRR